MKKTLFFLFAVVLAIAVFSTRTVQAQSAPRKIVIEAHRFTYSPDEITLKKGQPVVLVLKSQDVAHGLRFRDLGINVKVKAGGTTEIQFTPDKTGDFTGHCSTFCGSGHGSMVFKLHVVA